MFWQGDPTNALLAARVQSGKLIVDEGAVFVGTFSMPKADSEKIMSEKSV